MCRTGLTTFFEKYPALGYASSSLLACGSLGGLYLGALQGVVSWKVSWLSNDCTGKILRPWFQNSNCFINLCANVGRERVLFVGACLYLGVGFVGLRCAVHQIWNVHWSRYKKAIAPVLPVISIPEPVLALIDEGATSLRMYLEGSDECAVAVERYRRFLVQQFKRTGHPYGGTVYSNGSWNDKFMHYKPKVGLIKHGR